MPLTLPAAPTPPTLANPGTFEANASASLAWMTAIATAMTGKALLVGDFGLGGAGNVLPPGNNANNATAPGLYSMTPTTTNGPTGNTAALRVERSYNVVLQIASTSIGVYRRRSSDDGATWTAWVVDVERGSNANGEYTRWADGTQICTRLALIDATVSAATGASAIWTFPAAFASSVTPQTVVRGSNTTGGAISAAQFLRAAAGFGTTSAPVGLYNSSPASEVARVDVIAFGRWF